MVVEEGACCYSPFCCHDPDELQQQSHMYLLLREWLENISVSVCEGMFMNDPPPPCVQHDNKNASFFLRSVQMRTAACVC